MAAKYKFNKTQRYAIYMAYGGHCYWCNYLLEVRAATVDHVIPESLPPTKLEEVRTEYALGSSFALNDFENWVLSCQPCNGTKSETLLTLSPALILILEKVRRRAVDARKVYQKAKETLSASRIIGSLEAALENKTISPDVIKKLISETTPSHLLSALTERAEPPVFLFGEWRITKTDGDIAYVTDGHWGGYTYIGKGSDTGFRCPHCGSLGPWNGIRCLNCGQVSDPSD